MRSMLLACIFTVSFLCGGLGSTSRAAAQHCVTVDCYVDCWRVPGGRRCERRCLRRCWRPPPPSYDPPVYHAPTYVEPRSAPPQASTPPDLSEVLPYLALAVLFVIALVALVGDRSAALRNEIAKVEEETTAIQQRTDDTERTTKSIHSYIDQEIGRHYQAGRRQADDEWNQS
jgi:hypothetical protein